MIYNMEFERQEREQNLQNAAVLSKVQTLFEIIQDLLDSAEETKLTNSLSGLVKTGKEQIAQGLYNSISHDIGKNF